MIIDTFNTELARITDYIKKRLAELKDEKDNEMKNIYMRRAKDKSDTEIALDKLDKRIDFNKERHERTEGYFVTIAEAISLLVENINM